MESEKSNLTFKQNYLENSIENLTREIKKYQEQIKIQKETKKLYETVEEEYNEFLKTNNKESLKYIIFNGFTLVALSGVIGDLYNSILAFSVSTMLSCGLIYFGTKKAKEQDYQNIYISALDKSFSKKEIEEMNLSKKIYCCNFKIEELENNCVFFNGELEKNRKQLNSINNDLEQKNNITDINEHLDVKKKILKK